MRVSAFLALIGMALGAQEPELFKVERVSTGHRYVTGLAWTREGLLFSDLPAGVTLRVVAGKGVEEVRKRGAAGLAVDGQGRVVACESGARRVVRYGGKGEEVLAERQEGKRLNGPWGVAVRRDGQVYFTDPAYGKGEEGRELSYYGIYHLTPKGEMRVVGQWEKRPGGLAVSPNGKVLYVAGADERNIRVYDLDKNGTATNGRVFVEGLEGVPNGLALDEKGNVYAACSQVVVINGAGKVVRQIPLAETPSSLVFGDADRQSLYVAARTTLYRVRLDVKGPVQEP